MFGYENKQFYPIYKSKNAKYEDEMNLLLIASDKTNHYVYIQDFNRMMYNRTKNKKKTKQNIYVWAVYNVLAVNIYWKNIKLYV